MSYTAVKHSIAFAFLGLFFYWSAAGAAGQSESETKVVARLYRDHAWQAFAGQPELFGEGLTSESRVSLEKYFASDLAGLLVADSTCAIRERGICHLDFDPLFDSQDPRVTDLEVKSSSSGKVRVQFKDPVTDQTTRIDFELALERGKWRITDIIYNAHPQPSLKQMLSRPLPKG